MPERDCERSYTNPAKMTKSDIEGLITLIAIGVSLLLIGMVITTAFQSDIGALTICH